MEAAAAAAAATPALVAAATAGQAKMMDTGGFGCRPSDTNDCDQREQPSSGQQWLIGEWAVGCCCCCCHFAKLTSKRACKWDRMANGHRPP